MGYYNKVINFYVLSRSNATLSFYRTKKLYILMYNIVTTISSFNFWAKIESYILRCHVYAHFGKKDKKGVTREKNK